MTGVVVATGHMTDDPARPTPRFPGVSEPAVSRAVRAALVEWDVGRGWLVLCGGARGADLIVAEHALAVGADVELHLAAPVDEYAIDSVGPSWRARFDAVHRWSTTVVVEPGDDDRYVAVRRSLIARARQAAGDGPIHAVAVWDGEEGDGPGGTADMVAALEALLGDRGVLRIIHPTADHTSIGGISS